MTTVEDLKAHIRRTCYSKGLRKLTKRSQQLHREIQDYVRAEITQLSVDGFKSVYSLKDAIYEDCFVESGRLTDAWGNWDSTVVKTWPLVEDWIGKVYADSQCLKLSTEQCKRRVESLVEPKVDLMFDRLLLEMKESYHNVQQKYVAKLHKSVPP